MTFGERLKAERIKKGLTQDDLEKVLGIKQSYISKLENGIKTPSNGTLIALARYFSVTTDYLLLGE